MSNRHKKPTTSLDEKGTAKNQTGFSPNEFESEIQAAYESKDASRMLELLDSAPQRMKNQPGFMLFRATMLMEMGYEREALQLLRELERKYPRQTDICAPMAALYMDRGCFVHALRAAKRALSDRNLVDEARDSMEDLVQSATQELQHSAMSHAVSMEIMQQAAMYHEKALIAMDEDKLLDVDYYAQKAIQQIPNWNAPHNNRAQALYFTGKPREAIHILEGVVTRDVRNIFALHSLVIYYYGLDEIEKARIFADRLEALAPQLEVDGEDIEHVITALALVENTPALLKFAKEYLNQPAESLFGRSWHCLAVAAARMEKWKMALHLLYNADEIQELSPQAEELINQIQVSQRLRPRRLLWTPVVYPGEDLFLNSKVFSELDVILGASSQSSLIRQRKLESYFQKFPFVILSMKRMLWEEGSNSTALQILADVNQTNADAEILHFALSQVGNSEARMQAIMTLIQTGRYTGPKVIKLWNEELGEWREVSLNTQRIGNFPPNARPETMILIEKAIKAKKAEEAISLLRKAVEIEPACGIAIFNLGVKLVQNGNSEEGEPLIYKSVLADPGYFFGHASIALSQAEAGKEQSALEHLNSVVQADQITVETAVITNLAWCALSLRKRDIDTARKHLDFARELDPDHRLLEDFEEDLEKLEHYGFMIQYQRDSAVRAHQKLQRTVLIPEMSLQACLQNHTKDMLVGSAKFLGIPSSGKKGELVSWLASHLLDEEFLRLTLKEDLADQEREALLWMLEACGVRPWSEFARKYGEDLYESTYWIYHEPESIPGRLRISGLFFTGTLEGQQVAFIPADVRMLLFKLLTKHTA
jgi:tetratricopeptide (TPR) repeat protein